MLEYILVDEPTVYPNACLLCGVSKGPMLDTHTERFNEHIYLCRLCVSRGARAYGLVRGEKMDELHRAFDEIGEARRQLTVAQTEIEELRLANGGHRRKIGELRQQLSEAAGRAQTMGSAASELERIARTLVEVAGSEPIERTEAAA